MIKQMVRYGAVTVASYIILMSGTFFLVEFLKMSSTLSFFLVTTVVYIGVYFSNVKFVFNKASNKETIIKFILYLAVFWGLSNLFYSFLVHTLKIYYIYAMLCNVIILGLVRFFVQRKLVFNKDI